VAVAVVAARAWAAAMNTTTGIGMVEVGAAEPAGSTCEGLWSIFATDVGSFVRKPPEGCPARRYLLKMRGKPVAPRVLLKAVQPGAYSTPFNEAKHSLANVSMR
jgi:hypothetical protein